MKKLICTLAALLLLAAPALAEHAYRVVPPELDETALAACTAPGIEDAAFEQRSGDRRMLVCDAATCVYGPLFEDDPFMFRLNLFKNSPGSTLDAVSLLRDNVLSGVAACALTRDEAVSAATELLASFGLPDMVLSHTAAHGRIPGAWQGYEVVFDQTMNGLRVYVPPTPTGSVPFNTDDLRMRVYIGDGGVVMISGCFAPLQPTGDDLTLITEQEALAVFAQYGIEADAAERCYLLLDQDSVRPAYRAGISYVDAETGEPLVIASL